MGFLIGTYHCKTDTKGRVTIPSVLKRQLGDLNEGFVLKKHIFHNCLEVYPMIEWKKLFSKIEKLNRFKREHDTFVRVFMSGVRPVDIDANGRMLIPKDMIERVGMGKEIVLSATGSTFEIWDGVEYEKVNRVSEDDFASMAEFLMGNTDLNG